MLKEYEAAKKKGCDHPGLDEALMRLAAKVETDEVLKARRKAMADARRKREERKLAAKTMTDEERKREVERARRDVEQARDREPARTPEYDEEF